MKLASIVIDSNDSDTLSDFYQKLLGWKKLKIDEDWIIVFDENIKGPALTFQQIDNYQRPTWPSEKEKQQQMLHLDFYVEDKNFECEIEHALNCGAKELETPSSDGWRVMIDPAGHPFCMIPVPKSDIETRLP